ncbi:helix-turn-helix domain-containing protein [Cellulomonas endometrii]|uniref:helix-turn-helix domain-containing protein n=1 Tax=Cellulomonas endometrii TaxID=3036301 RepID=UPI0024AE2988|nr:helix-turn-helix transcriptional regulator [Cellulomonas endometrii]
MGGRRVIVVQPLIWVWTRAGRSPSVGRVDGELQRVVGRNIRRIRNGRGLSQEALADDIDVHRTFLGAVERGERNLTLRTVERLAQRLGVPTRELVDDGGGTDGAGDPGGGAATGATAGTASG